MTVRDRRIAASPHAFPLSAPLDLAHAALIAIDMQGDFCLPGGYMDAIRLSVATLRAPLVNAARLIAAFRASGGSVIHTREGFAPDLSDAQPNRLWRGEDGGHPIVGDRGPLGRYLIRGEPGWEIVPEVAPIEGEVIFDKPSYGAFSTTAIGAYLSENGIHFLIVCGVTSDCCVHLTVQEALDRGFECLTVSDASAAAFTSVHEHLMQQIVRKGGVFGAVATTDEVIAALSAD